MKRSHVFFFFNPKGILRADRAPASRSRCSCVLPPPGPWESPLRLKCSPGLWNVVTSCLPADPAPASSLGTREMVWPHWGGRQPWSHPPLIPEGSRQSWWDGFFLTNLETKVSIWNDVWGKWNSKLLCLFWILGTKHILNITISSSCGDCLVAKSCPTLLRPHGLQPARLLSLPMGLNLCLLHYRWILYHWASWEALLWRCCLYFYKLKLKRISMPTKSGLVRCPIYNPLS